jgi:iron complex transport system substrate-binding protein
MRAFAFALALSLALALAAPVDAAPRRAVSLNLCTDELLLLIARPDQIASVTHLSQQPAESPLWRQARQHPKNDGSLASVAGLRPDLVLTMGGGGSDRLRIAARLGIRTLDLPFPQSLTDVERSVVLVAGALGRPESGREISARFAALRRTPPLALRDTIWLAGGGRTVPDQGLAAQWMALAGMRQRTVPGTRVPLETLLARPPEILLRSEYRVDQYSGAQRWLHHPLARGAGRARLITTDGRRWTCMGPLLVGEVQRLRKVLAR